MILEIKNGCFGYPKQDIILADINLSLEEGHILAILGPNLSLIHISEPTRPY